MPDVEFLTGDPGGEDEVLDTGPRRPVPRLVIAAAIAAVVALVVIVVARQGGATPVADPATPVSSSDVTSPPLITAVPNLDLSDTYALVGDPRSQRLFALSGTSLFAIAPSGQPIGHGDAVQVGDPSNADVELVLDAAHRTVWAVPQNATGHNGIFAGFAEPFTTKPLSPQPRIPLPGLVESAAALDGELYVTTSAGLWRTTSPGAPFEQVGIAPTTANAMLVADPARDRLICVRFGPSRTLARFFRLGHPISPAMTLPARTISLAVVGRTIWLGGSRQGRALLTTLDPGDLHASGNIAHGTSDVELDGTGTRSLYVTVGSRLQCLSGSTGRLLHDFGPTRGAFASVDGRGFFGTMDALHPVPLGRCPG